MIQLQHKFIQENPNLSSNLLPSQNKQNTVSPLKITLPDYQIFNKSQFSQCSRKDSLLQKDEAEIEVSPVFAWILLLLNMLFTAIVPCWIISNLNYEQLTRNSWRFFTISILTLPFVAYQKRKIAESGGSIWELVTIDNLKTNVICGINFCIWLLIITYAIKFTSFTHAFSLVGLKHFLTTIMKLYKKQKHHDFQNGGIILIALGIFCMFYDSMTGQIIPGIYNQRYLSYSNISRVFGDLLAFFGSIVDVLLGEKYQVPTSPRFLNLFMYNIGISFNLISLGYFFGGSEISFNEYYGVFGLFTGYNFVSIFYVAIMLGINLMLSNILVNQIFSPFIIKMSSSFHTLLIALFLNMFDVELTYSGYTALSFGFIVPGLILILSGQNALQNKDIKIDYVIYRPNIQQTPKQSTYEMKEIKTAEKQRKL